MDEAALRALVGKMRRAFEFALHVSCDENVDWPTRARAEGYAAACTNHIDALQQLLHGRSSEESER